MGKRLRILYAAGPGNVLGTYQYWRAGRDDPSEVSITYSAQFFAVCEALDARGYIISSNRHRVLVEDGRQTIVHRPIPFSHGPGVLYHLGQLWAALRLIASAIWFRADWVIVANGSGAWFPLRILPLVGINVVPSLHNLLWRKNRPRRLLRSRLYALCAGRFFARSAAASMSVSRDIVRQVQDLAGGQQRKMYEFSPTYRRDLFRNMGAVPVERTPFRVFFAGRIERTKGVFAILQIARQFQRDGHHNIEFDLCGDGRRWPSCNCRSPRPDWPPACGATGIAIRKRCGPCSSGATWCSCPPLPNSPKGSIRSLPRACSADDR